MPEALRTAVVTGGSRGIGRAIVEDLLYAGWRVISVSRHQAHLPHPNSSQICADLSSLDGIEMCIDSVKSSCDRLDLLVNNAGEIHDGEDLMNVTAEAMAHSWRIHVLAPLLVSRSLAVILKTGSAPSVVNMKSVYGDIVDSEVLAYGTSKCALGYLTSALAHELAPDIRVNSVSPGHVNTEMTKSAPADYLAQTRDAILLKRFAEPAEVAAAVRFLASEDAAFITGVDLVMDGGYRYGR